jgi:hypothetical protein
MIRIEETSIQDLIMRENRKYFKISMLDNIYDFLVTHGVYNEMDARNARNKYFNLMNNGPQGENEPMMEDNQENVSSEDLKSIEIFKWVFKK